jgi:hypothetical protein
MPSISIAVGMRTVSRAGSIVLIVFSLMSIAVCSCLSVWGGQKKDQQWAFGQQGGVVAGRLTTRRRKNGLPHAIPALDRLRIEKP